jgi:rhamnosyl/mannosyltransferase
VANAALAPRFFEVFHRGVTWADVVHFHVPSPLAELAHLCLGVPSDTSVVTTFHADPASTRWKALAPVYNLVLHPLLRRSDRIVVTAPENARDIDVLSNVETQRDVIPLGTEYSPDPPSDEEKRALKQEHLGIDPDTPVTLFVGRLAYYKGLPQLIDAMHEVPGVLIVIGTGEQEDKLKSLVDSRNLNNVRFEGYVTDDLLPRYYRSADVFAFPSVSPSEAFGIVQLDAMAHGLPVVNTNLPTGVPFVSQSGTTGLTVPPFDTSALTRALCRILEDDAFRASLSSQAVRRASDLTVDHMVERYSKLISNIL